MLRITLRFIVLISGGLVVLPPAAAKDEPLYQVVDGNKVDPNTFIGYQTWQAAGCARCHGYRQEGMMGPSLIKGLKSITKEEFMAVMREGRLEKGMPGWKDNKEVMDNINPLYAYLKGRSDGAITDAEVEPLPK